MTTHDEHSDHVLQRDYRFVSCVLCRQLLIYAQQNHAAHAWNPEDIHSNAECVDAYRHYAKKMSES